MALQSSGAISISQIRTELGSSSYSLRTLSAAAGKGTPDAMSEFYGYSASTDVQIYVYVPNYAGCANYYCFYATSSTAVNTTVAVNISWYGDLGGAFTGTVYINSGTTCGTNCSVYSGGAVNCLGEYFNGYGITITPSSNGGQNYLDQGYYTDINPC